MINSHSCGQVKKFRNQFHTTEITQIDGNWRLKLATYANEKTVSDGETEVVGEHRFSQDLLISYCPFCGQRLLIMDDKSFDGFVKGKAVEEKTLLLSGVNQKIPSTLKELPKRKKCYPRLLRLGSVAAILGICVLTGIGFVSPSFASNVRNVSYTISSNISDFLDILLRNLAEHKTVINKEITDNSITVKLNEVILNGNELTVSCNISPNIYLEENKNLSWPGFNSLSVNGKEINGEIGEQIGSDDNTIHSVINYDLGETLSGDLDIKLLSSAMSLKDKEKKASWNFEFKIKGNQSKMYTKEILLFVTVAVFIFAVYGVWITGKKN